MTRSLFGSLLSQFAVGGLSLAVSAALLAFATPLDFAAYSFLFNMTISLWVVQNTLVNVHFAVACANAPTADAEHAALRPLVEAGLVLTVLAAAVAMAVAGTVEGIGPVDQGLAGVYAAMFLLREMLRTIQFARLEVRGAVRQDIAFTLTTLAVLGPAWLAFTPLRAVLVSFAAGGIVMLAVAAATAAVPVRLSSLGVRGLWRRYRAVWRDARWALAGALVTEVQNRSYVFVVLYALGAVVLADLQAGRFFFMPLMLLSTAWGRWALPFYARSFSAGGHDRARNVLWTATGVVVAMNGVFGLALYAAWPLIDAHLLGDAYRDVGPLVAGWAVVTVLFQVRGNMSLYFQAQRRYRMLARLAVVGAAVCVAILCTLPLAGVPWIAVVAVGVGEAAILACMAVPLAGSAPASVAAR